jgi:hypothetical protein
MALQMSSERDPAPFHSFYFISLANTKYIIRYVLTRWVEKLVPIRRLTTILMPHRERTAGLRSRTDSSAAANTTASTIVVSEFCTMSSIAALKYGLTKKLYRSKGWLYRLLMKEGINFINHYNVTVW